MPRRPNYPFNDKVDNNVTRHHIIPWESIMNEGVRLITTQEQITDLFKKYQKICEANIGCFLNKEELIDEIILQNNEAIETYKELLAWLPGNLVVGPSERDDDPGQNIDLKALAFMQETNNGYERLANDWNDENSRINVIHFLAGGCSLDATEEKW